MSKREDSPTKKQLLKRLETLEYQMAQQHPTTGLAGAPPQAPDIYCAVPELSRRQMSPEISAHREELIRYMARKWVNGTTIHYYFFDSGPYGGGQDQQEIVREAFGIWADIGIGLRFEEVTNIDQAEVRIGFLSGDGYWSYVGTDVLSIGQHERTMNFGQDLNLDPRGVDVPVHEIGHTLGFPHEHQNPMAGIVWDEAAVHDLFSGPPNNWDAATIDHNILRKIPQGSVDGSPWDADSVMHYGFPAGLILQPAEYRNSPLRPAPGLSDIDKEQVRAFYPPMQPNHPQLLPFQSVVLGLDPGDQANFSIEPPATDDYTLQTFGRTDSVMVLFELLDDGSLVFVAGDDDSGWNHNARLQVRLYEGRTYVVRVRLYFGWASGQMALMLW